MALGEPEFMMIKKAKKGIQIMNERECKKKPDNFILLAVHFILNLAINMIVSKLMI